MHWFVRHKEILELFSEELSTNSNYNETGQARNEYFISSGDIVLRLHDIHRLPIIIVFTDATPFELPKIFLLKKHYSREKVELFSKLLNLYDIINAITNNIKVFYEYRHQNSDGSLCILENDLVDKGPEIFSISDIFKKVKDWFYCVTTDTPFLENPQVEYYAHFKSKEYGYEFLYDDNFLNEKIIEGEFCFFKIKEWKSELHNIFVEIFFSLLIHGKNTKNIFIPLISQYNSIYSYKDLDKYNSFDEKIKYLKSNYSNDKFIIGYWWHINEVLPLTKDCNDLINIISFDRFPDRLINDIYNQKEKIYLGCRYSNNNNDYEFQFFILKRLKSINMPIIGEKTEQAIRDLLCNYELYAIKQEHLNDKNYHIRNKGVCNRDSLKDVQVGIVGCGSLGGEIADTLTKAGIGKLYLCDNQIFRAHNSIRHVISMDWIGANKDLALYRKLISHNPFIKINLLEYNNILRADFTKIDKKVIFVSSIADDNIEGYINEQAVYNDIIFYYVRALRGAKTARIIRVIPGSDACLHCLTLYRKEKDYIEIPENLKLPTIMNECNNPIRPGSAADLKMISSITSRIILDNIINQHSTTPNHWIWSTEVLDWIPNDDDLPFRLFKKNYTPHPDCHYCNKKEKKIVKMYNSVIKFIENEVEKNINVETGGVIVGLVDNKGIYTITKVSDAGPKAIKKSNEFIRDTEYCQNFIDIEIDKNKDTVYLGEWHYHSIGTSQPSSIDVHSLFEIANDSNYLTEKPILLIISKDRSISVTVFPFNKPYYQTIWEEISDI